MNARGSPYHIGVQCRHELAGSTGQSVRLVQTVVEVPSLEVMWLAGDLLACHVVDFGVGDRELVDRVFQRDRFAIVQHNHPEPAGWIILVACATHRVENNFIVLSAASDEDIHGGDIIPSQSQLGSTSLLQRHHGPAIVHQGGDHHGDLDGNEHPGAGIAHARYILRRDNAENSQSQVEQVQPRVGKGKKRGETEDPSLPALPDLRIVAVMESSDRPRLDPILGEACLGRCIDERSETLMAFDLRVVVLFLIKTRESR